MGSPNDLALWRVDVRVPRADWERPSVTPSHGLCAFSIDPDPPASGPEVQLSFTVGALSAQGAELRARAMMASRGLSVLAIRSRPREEAAA